MYRRQGGDGDGGGEFPNSRLESLGPQQPQLQPPPPAIPSNSNLFLSSIDPPPSFPMFDGGLMDDPEATLDTPAIPSPMEDDDWWANALEEDLFESPLAFDASENGLWNGRFVPPPPRPPFLDDSVATDGLTTCDLCTWAWQRGNPHSSE
uniref:Uncharacterized protein n=1 Tax=Megaselia scalaris TaxID=36166 RepID=T1GGV3_MEGSC